MMFYFLNHANTDHMMIDLQLLSLRELAYTIELIVSEFIILFCEIYL